MVKRRIGLCANQGCQNKGTLKCSACTQVLHCHARTNTRTLAHTYSHIHTHTQKHTHNIYSEHTHQHTDTRNVHSLDLLFGLGKLLLEGLPEGGLEAEAQGLVQRLGGVLVPMPLRFVTNMRFR